MHRFSSLSFVPKHEPPTVHDVRLLQSFLNSKSQTLVLTGAGVSTESGIPDYRSEGVGLYARSTRRPTTIQQFVSSRYAQKSYWARNFFGWPRFAALHPNVAHSTIRNWEYSNKISGLVTQNVDGLHQKAGSKDVIELHGTGHLVICMSCDYSISRHLFQNILLDLNCHLDVQPNLEDVRPDGDIDLIQEAVDKFNLPFCPKCSTGALKPYIVFFGDNVPKDRVDKISDVLKRSDSLLVLGSSLETFSSYRYILAANQLELPIGIISLGPTRADALCSFKIKSRVGEILPLIKL
ncbi:NAD-dependent protein deacylase Sirt4 [Orchesella cincta]|uniref:NAD-dependent protein deacylase Sirt4 n=1 Tax=Orchesella cincta TaxID=48709 RepID=A0A1D2NBH7_ORCCI|nr:NAD-dependent protein deacylase Sirt4 [Orchesella cincta]